MTKRRLPKKLHGSTIKEEVGCGSLYVTANRDGRNDLRQVIAILGKSGGCSKAMLEALGRTINIGLDHHVPIGEYIRGLNGIRCPEQVLNRKHITSCADGIAKLLSEDAKTTSPD